MGAQGLSSRALIGRFFYTLENLGLRAWVPDLSMHFFSDQASEEYKWLGQTPRMRDWIGTRKPKGFRENGLTVTNKKFEASIEIDADEARRDKTTQINTRVDDLAARAMDHWNSLISTFINNGTTATNGLAYDGQFFFDTDHEEDESGVQSNNITVDISALPVTQHGSVTDPSVDEAAEVIFTAIAQMMSFVDNEGEPMNEDAQQFIVLSPMGTTGALWKAAVGAVNSMNVSEGRTNPLAVMGADFQIRVFANTRLTDTDAYTVYRADSQVAAFIRQSERMDGGAGGDLAPDQESTADIRMDVVAEGSEMEALHDKWLMGVKALRNVAYGYWQNAIRVTMV